MPKSTLPADAAERVSQAEALDTVWQRAKQVDTMQKEIVVLTLADIHTALRAIEPGSELERVVERWQGFTHVVQTDGKWRLTGFITCFQHLVEVMNAIDPSIEPNPPQWCFDPKSVSRMFNIPLKKLQPWPDGPVETGVFWLRGERYQLIPSCFRLVSVLWSAPGRSLWLEDVLAKVWGVRPAALDDRHVRKVRTCASRINIAIPGIVVSVTRDRLIGRLRVSLVTL